MNDNDETFQIRNSWLYYFKMWKFQFEITRMTVDSIEKRKCVNKCKNVNLKILWTRQKNKTTL